MGQWTQVFKQLCFFAVLFWGADHLALAEDSRQATETEAPLVLLQADTAELSQKVSVIKSFFAKTETGMAQVAAALGTDLLEGKEVKKVRSSLQSHLTVLEEQKDSNKNYLLEKELVGLKLNWLDMPEADRKALVDAANEKEQISENLQKSKDTISESDSQLKEVSETQDNLADKLNRDVSDRERQVLQKSLEVNQTLEEALQRKRELALLRSRHASELQNWSKEKEEIENRSAKEDLVERSKIEEALLEKVNLRLQLSNQLVGNEAAFLKQIPSASKQVSDGGSLALLEEDSSRVQELISATQAKLTELKALQVTNSVERRKILGELLRWERQYRIQLLDKRGELLSSLQFHLRNNLPLEQLALEFQTIASSVVFWFWSWGESKAVVSEVSVFEQIQYLWDIIGRFSKLLMLLAFVIFLLIRKQYILGSINEQLKVITQRWKTAQQIDIAFGLFGDLYTFLILLLIGQFLISFAVGLGLQEAAYLIPHFRNALIFFFLWGVIDFIRPYISQRRLYTSGNQEEVQAIENTFSFIPKAILLFWLTESTVDILLQQYLRESFLNEYSHQALFALAGIGLYAGVRALRLEWRLIARKVSAADFWQSLMNLSEEKIWEPVVLLLGGGLGVYFVAWRLIRKRLGDLEIARSFQAMVSRAILERNKRKSLSRIVSANFPENYLSVFDPNRPAEATWFVERSEFTAVLEDTYKRWSAKNFGTTALILGERGIGKSELIYNFMSQKNDPKKSLRLFEGDTTKAHILTRLGEQLGLSQEVYSQSESLVQALRQLPPSIICLENLENSFLRKVGGFDALAFAVDLMVKTSGHHLWLVTFTSSAWAIAKRAVPGIDCFSSKIVVSRMSEQEIRRLVLNRHSANQGLDLDFSNLSLSTKEAKKLNQGDIESKRQDLYFRILWDYTNGNPRQALFFWKASLTWQNQKAKVSIFDVPEQDILESLSDKCLMLLAAIMEHNGLTVDGLSEVLNESTEMVSRWAEEASPYEIIYSCPIEGGGRGWQIESFWTRTLENYLIKRQLIFSGGRL